MATPSPAPVAASKAAVVELPTQWIIRPPGSTSIQLRKSSERPYVDPHGVTKVLPIPGFAVHAVPFTVREEDLAINRHLTKPDGAVLEFEFTPEKHRELFVSGADRESWMFTLETLIERMKAEPTWWRRLMPRRMFIEGLAQVAEQKQRAENERKALFETTASKIGGGKTADDLARFMSFFDKE